jgi:geranylgeranyl diphosphate synthase, type I
VLVALTLQHAEPAAAAVVRTRLGDPALDADGVAAVQDVIVESGALRRVEDQIAELTARGLAALDAAPVAGPAKAVLADLAVAATERSG